MDTNYLENNYLTLVGKVTGEKKFSHEIYGEKFYRFSLSIARLSGNADIIPITISERLITDETLTEGKKLLIKGQFRSYNSFENERNKLILTVFAKDVQELPENEEQEVEVEGEDGEIAKKEEMTNEVVLIGFVCKKPIYRQTPFGREIADLLLAVNRAYNKSDYIPTIAWGRNARFCQNIEVGTQVKIIGRVQSRQYEKKHEDGTVETKTAYEVSVCSLEVINEEGNENKEETEKSKNRRNRRKKKPKEGLKIAIEAQRIFRPNKHGMDFVALETIRELQKRNDGNQYFVIVAPGEDRCLKESPNLSIIELNSSTYPIWEQVALPRIVKRLGVDLLHCTSNTAPLRCPVPLVLTLHDIIYLEPRQHRSPSLYQEMGWHYRRLVVPRILKKCKKIITVSQFECDRIRHALNIPSERITAIYNGYSTHFTQQATIDLDIVRKYIPHNDFLFFLGNTDPKKNAARTLKAYSLYLQQSEVKRPLLIADLKKDYIDHLLDQEKIIEIKSYLYYPGYIANKDLATLYNAAFAFLYPSLRESFGIPMIEAMACGTPIIIGNTSAMPEVAGVGAMSVDPYKPEEISNAILKLEIDSALYQRQKEYGITRASLFSWEKTASECVELYQSLHL